MVQLKLESIINENLFSRNYLEEKLVETTVWETDEELEEAFERAKQIYENNKDILPTLTNNEGQLEDIFIKPIFEEVLGHNFAVQEITKHTAKQPDYGFFENEEDMREAFKNKGEKDFYQKSIAIGDAKAWEKDLDKKVDGRKIFDNKNPSFQIDYYLNETPPSWGVLTNGRKWRLYYEERSHRLDTYYEVDLVDIIEKDNLESFKYFNLCFRKEAFTPVGDSFLDELYQESLKYSQEIGEDLEDNIYQALLWMAKGYFNMKSNELDKTKENLEIVHKNSLIFLYRLMFLFYADNNELIPSDLPGTYDDEYSFSKWVEDILWDVHQGNVSHGGGLYNHKLFRIFKLINKGSEELGIPKDDFYVPPYNGGLFNPDKHPFLSEKKIQDGYIAKVVELLAKADEEDREEWLGGRIDYSDLSLRHIGGIYEGLLEYKLKIADEDIVAEKDKDTLKWIPVEEAKREFEDYSEDRRAKEGEIYLATDKGERKATGSYYTPEYIVQYIVENTVDPVIEEKIESGDTGEEIREEILSTKVLDPAMGSGHFLIDALDNIAAKLSEYAPVEEIEDEREIDWAKREVARNCIYGVDVNPLATELAKVSVWLNTLEKDKPLSFIDHHLKTGNSLIGADIHDLDKHPEKKSEENGQSALTSFLGVNVTDRIKELLKVYKSIVDIVEEEAKDIKEEENLYQKFEEHPFRKKFELLANVYTSYFFDNEFSVSQYEELLKAFKENPSKWEELLDSDWVKTAQKLSKNKDFFYWKLEFPEVFFNVEKGTEKNNSGFDCVIGNPPWGESVIMDIKNYLEEKYEVPKQNLNSFDVFLRQSLSLTIDRLGFLVPRNFSKSNDYNKLREFVLKHFTVENLKDWKKFPGITLEAMSVILFDNLPDESKLISINDDKFLTQADLLNNDEYILNIYSNKEEYEIKERIKNGELGWGNLIEIKRGEEISRSAKVMQCPNCKYWRKHSKKDSIKCPNCENKIERDDWIIDSLLTDKNEGERIVDGTDIEEYFLDTGRWIDLDRKGIETKKDLNIYGPNKILMKKISKKPVATYDIDGVLYTQNVYGMNIKERCDFDGFFLTAFLNSKCMKFFYEHEFNLGADWTTAISIKNIRENFPIPNFSEDARNQIKKLSKKAVVDGNKFREEKENFLKWLEREWKVDIDDLSLKTHLREYWDYEFDEMLRIAKKNESEIGEDPSSRKFQERLEEEWQKSIDTINPLLEEVQQLENEIDALVFKLYDLTEEEVEIVLDSLDTEDTVKEDIIEKFQGVREE